jgi:hypothetical protein
LLAITRAFVRLFLQENFPLEGGPKKNLEKRIWKFLNAEF